MTNVISILNYYSFIPLFQTTSFLKTLIISDLTSYNLFHYNMFTLYNKYLILIFIFLYYIIIYLYYLIPKLLNVTFINLKFNFLFRYEYPILIGFLLLGYTLVINSNNLFIVYLGFEIQTFIILILSGQLRLFLTVITTSLKYFFYSILSSLLFLLSLLYLYSFSGTLNFYELNYFLIYN
jgi:NADH:ubiquinone oxidoreductase subunit 2 (subunit N)